jgi:hypothetical protein
MLVTKGEILAQIQHDNSKYDAWSDALKEVLRVEVEVVRQPSDRNERLSVQPHFRSSLLRELISWDGRSSQGELITS